MYNLLVSASGWPEGRNTFSVSRTFEATEKPIVEIFKPAGVLDLQALIRLPTLFVEETSRQSDQVARVGTITDARISGTEIRLEYFYDPAIAGIPNTVLEEIRSDFGISDRFEFSRTHWAVKDVDLYRALLRHLQPRRQQPRVFRIAETERIEPTLVSAMMPFDPRFDAVYATLQRTSEAVKCRCRRADDIWENPEVIQDVVNLIDRSKVVICDCTGRNPNVFYEAGIAHTLGREVILITQNQADIPFDLRHLRYLTYLNNGEGLNDLASRLLPRLADLVQ